jgi:hypothetical protein
MTLDDLREQGSTFDDKHKDTGLDFDYEVDFGELPEKVSRRRKRYFLGLTPLQRFILATMLLMITCILGTFFLLVTERIVLPLY